MDMALHSCKHIDNDNAARGSLAITDPTDSALQACSNMCRSLPASPHCVSARTRPRKRKQPAPYTGIRSDPLLEPSLDDALLSAANARIRSGRPGRRPARGGKGSGSAGQSPEAPSAPMDASEPKQALLAVTARLAAETRSPRLPRPQSAAGCSPDPAAQTAAPAPQEAPQSPPFWHLPPVSPPQHAHALASPPQPAPLQGSELNSAGMAASQSRATAGQLFHESRLNAPQNPAVGRVKPPLCRKSLDFSGAARGSEPRSLQRDSSAGSPIRDSTHASTEQGIEQAGVGPLPEQADMGQRHVSIAPGVQERPHVPGNGEETVQTGPPTSAGQACPDRGGDAELMIGGVLTRWTKVSNIPVSDVWALHKQPTCANITREP